MYDCFKRKSVGSNKGFCIYLKVIGIIFVAEFLVMALLSIIQIPSGILEFIADSVLLSLLSAPFLYFVVVKDITRRLNEESLKTQAALEKELKAQAYAEKMAVKAYADTIVNNVNTGLVVVTSDLNVFRVNPAFCSTFSIKAGDAEGKRIEDILPFADLKEAIRDTFNCGSECENIVLESTSQGNKFFRIGVSRMNISESEEASSQALIVIEDITQRKQSEEKIIQLANYDSLTGLPNRRLLMSSITQAINLASRRAIYAAVLFIDLDRFKVVNDTLGHTAGDHMLQEVAERLKKCVRLSDMVARLGGDEFIVLLPDIEHIDDIVIICNRISAIFETPVRIGEHDVNVMMSIGISVYPTDGLDGEALLSKADVAMYRAKSDGKGCFRFFSEGMSQSGADRLRLENRLRGAAERGELSLYYQPKTDISTGRIYGAEALLRWHDPVFGYIPPSDFIPIAEESGLIVPIGKWLLHTACMQAKAWQDKGLKHIKISVNISLRQFRQKDFADLVESILTETGLDAGNLEIELTESIIMNNVETVLKILNDLKEIGISLAIDDFGTGYSSLIYLKLMPIDIIKIDQSFVSGIMLDENDKAICNAIIKLAKSLNLDVIAEGVETTEQLELLKMLDCRKIQGYLISKPLSSDDFERYLSEDACFDVTQRFSL